MDKKLAQIMNLDEALCARRNRLAALRYGLETAPLELASSTPVAGTPDFVRGKVPTDPTEVMTLINALQPAGAPKLSAEDVYILPVMQAANTNFIPDRYMFLGSSTLKNIQREAAAGFAFMNSHRTGSLSTPSEQPFGRTYAGRYERYPAGMGPAKYPMPKKGKGKSKGPMMAQSAGTGAGAGAGAGVSPIQFERTLLGTYMLKGVYPNGPTGPSTDDIYRQVMGGVMHDVSMGLNGGQKMCDVCGYELREGDCNHVPGTGHNVSKDQSRTQSARGVHRGLASYTLEDSHSGEVSGVYDGAIPGAGFSKAVEFFKTGRLQGDEVSDMIRAYSSLLEGDNTVVKSIKAKALRNVKDQALSLLEIDPTDDEDDEEDDEDSEDDDNVAVDVAPDEPKADAKSGGKKHRLSELAQTAIYATPTEERLARANEELQTRLNLIEASQRSDLAFSVVHQAMQDNHLFDAGKSAAICLANWIVEDDSQAKEVREFTTGLGQKKRMTRLQLFAEVLSNVPQHDLFNDHELTSLPPGAILLSGSMDNSEDLEISKAKEDAKKVIDRKKKLARSRSRNGNSNGNGAHDDE